MTVTGADGKEAQARQVGDNHYAIKPSVQYPDNSRENINWSWRHLYGQVGGLVLLTVVLSVIVCFALGVF